MENRTEKKLIIRPRRAALGKTSVVSVRLSDDMIKRLVYDLIAYIASRKE